MVSRRRFLVLLGATSAAAGAAAAGFSILPGGAADAGSGPPSIRYGEESCASCGMVIADPRFAAAWREPSGRTARFDDIGCMATKLRQQPPDPASAFYVHDYGDESWLDAATAAFVVASAIKSPMAYGIAAFASAESARALAGTAGTSVVDWDTVRAEAGKAGTM